MNHAITVPINYFSPKTISTLMVISAAIGWGALGSFVVAAPAGLSPLGLSTIRGAWIATCLLILLNRNGTRLIVNRKVVFAGFIYALSALTYLVSLNLIAVAVAAPLHYTAPVFLLFGRMLFEKIYPARPEWWGVLVSTIGSITLLSASSIDNIPGASYAVLSAVLWAAYLGLQANLADREKMSAACFGGIFLIPVGLDEMTGSLFSLSALSTFMLIGVFSSTMPLICLAKAGRYLAPVPISLILLCEPVFAAIIACVVNGQIASSIHITGLLLVVIGAGIGILAKPAASTNRKAVS